MEIYYKDTPLFEDKMLESGFDAEDQSNIPPNTQLIKDLKKTRGVSLVKIKDHWMLINLGWGKILNDRREVLNGDEVFELRLENIELFKVLENKIIDYLELSKYLALLGRPMTDLEDLILKHPHCPIFYTTLHNIKNNPKMNAEIAKSARESYEFADKVLKGPFKEGEEAISRSPEYSFYYAQLLGERFLLGEKALRDCCDPEGIDYKTIYSHDFNMSPEMWANVGSENRELKDVEKNILSLYETYQNIITTLKYESWFIGEEFNNVVNEEILKLGLSDDNRESLEELFYHGEAILNGKKFVSLEDFFNETLPMDEQPIKQHPCGRTANLSPRVSLSGF